MRRLANSATQLAGLVAAALVVVSPTANAAGTSMSVNGYVVTITVMVDVVGAQGETGPDGRTSLVDHWQKIIEDTWGAAFGRLPYKNCYRFDLKPKLIAQRRDFGSTPGRHRILVAAKTDNRSFGGIGFEGAAETSRNRATGDGTRSFEQDRDGALAIDAYPTVVAHEFGHLLGLGDDRENGAPKNGRDGTMMVGGVPGLDLTKIPRIDKELVERIGRVIEQYLKISSREPLAPCETLSGTQPSRWSGTLRSRWNGSVCTGTQQGTITLTVLGKEVTGSSATSGKQSCPEIPFSQGGPQSARLAGEFSGDEFRLQVREVTGLGDATSGCWGTTQRPIVVKLTGARTAQARFEWAMGTEKYSCEITLERQGADRPVS